MTAGGSDTRGFTSTTARAAPSIVAVAVAPSLVAVWSMDGLGGTDAKGFTSSATICFTSITAARGFTSPCTRGSNSTRTAWAAALSSHLPSASSLSLLSSFFSPSSLSLPWSLPLSLSVSLAEPLSVFCLNIASILDRRACCLSLVLPIAI